MTLGLLIIRVIAGLTMAAHGSQKLFGWFDGAGRRGTAGMMEKLGFRETGRVEPTSVHGENLLTVREL